MLEGMNLSLRNHDPTRYILTDDSLRNKPRVREIIENCRGAQELSKTEADQMLRHGVSATTKYLVGKKTLQIKELKRSTVHFFGPPLGTIENPQLIINHGMNCPHFCQYCYWHKDLHRRARIEVNANEMEEFVKDIKIAAAIWRIFTAFQQTNSCVNKMSSRIFDALDKRIRNKTKTLDYEGLNSSNERKDYIKFLRACVDCTESNLASWDVPETDRAFIREFVTNPVKYPAKVIFNSGENNDSVAWEHITRVQQKILIPTILSMDEAYVILRTKSIHFDFLEDFKDHSKQNRIIISPSLIPEYFVKKYEAGNHSLQERLAALRKVADWGYKIYPSFSPIIYEKGSWREKYREFIETFRRYLPPEKVQYYALGMLRFSRQALTRIREVHSDIDIYVPGFFVKPEDTSGDKYRYGGDIVRTMYAFFIREMNKNGYDKVPHILQTELIEIWRSLMTEQCRDLDLRLEDYVDGRLDIEALT